MLSDVFQDQQNRGLHIDCNLHNISVDENYKFFFLLVKPDGGVNVCALKFSLENFTFLWKSCPLFLRLCYFIAIFFPLELAQLD